jgi:small subunit ribosomal protein S20
LRKWVETVPLREVAADRRRSARLLPSARPLRGRFHAMPNIKQQKKRVRIAAEERLENLRYASTVKTFTRRLRAAVEEGDAERIATEHRALVRWIDKAASRGALHRNTAARKKAQAAKLAGGGSTK